MRGAHQSAAVQGDDDNGFGPAGSGSHVPTRYETDCGLSEGFKQLNDFIHGDSCGCVDDTYRCG